MVAYGNVKMGFSISVSTRASYIFRLDEMCYYFSTHTIFKCENMNIFSRRVGIYASDAHAPDAYRKSHLYTDIMNRQCFCFAGCDFQMLHSMIAVLVKKGFF